MINYISMESLRLKNKKRTIKHCSTNCDNAVDRISELPDEIIHKILALIPTVEAVRLSLLSTRWRHAWREVPSLNVSLRDTPFRSSDKLSKRFVKEWLNRRLESNVTSIRLLLSLSSGVCVALTRLLSSPRTLNNVKELDLDTWCSSDNYFPFEALNSTSLSVLKLKGLTLSGLSSISANLPSLRQLNLFQVALNNDELNHLLSRCPSLERLELTQCSYLNRLEISSSTLKSLEVSACYPEILSVRALNLRALTIHGSYPETDFSGCAGVRNLELRNFEVDDDRILSVVKNTFTRLESLDLQLGTIKRREFAICNETLRSFSMNKGKAGVKLNATFEMPNLESFNYDGDLRFGLTMYPPNDELNAKFVSRETRFNYAEMLRFFSGLHWSCNVLTIDLHSHQLHLDGDLYMKDSNSKSMWPALQHMDVKYCRLSESGSEFKSELKRYEAMLERSSSFGKQMWKAIRFIFDDYPNKFPKYKPIDPNLQNLEKFKRYRHLFL